MEPLILDGRKLKEKLMADLKQKISENLSKFNRPPGLATVLVGNDKASQVYVNMKNKTCDAVGIRSFKKIFPENISIEKLYMHIESLNSDPTVDGILVQMPLPKHLRQYESKVMEMIASDKDVDGFHPNSIGLNTFGDETYGSCTPKGMIRLLEENNIPIDGQEVVIVNRTNVIGKPIVMMFLNRSATVTVCHSHTRDLDFHLKRADIIAVGVGKINFITKDRIKEGVVLLDAGINRTEDGILVGDVDYDSVYSKCSAITPVPGGVGPMTIAMLMENTFLSYMRRENK
ncbi:bifunctional 5,10-methylenetetrahydrofolate dehydrogenase/5,10-methenyltetrahydrofolate cyclohydrolase [Candidatus Lokiarchaeum ossiferum]|uniref:bifunctional 5,10-methylenetetrahydrofolate dehydrogenase/5,10-methenyltetrahydrofolate cyclohydrolase n=1 Tax=Candidatus Lokiarchaeum ossiferum TaxID=2951803 RepID=UPI00352FC9BD